jgi:hypothetical protein
MFITDEPTYDPSDLATTLLAAVTALLRTPQLRQGLYDLLRTYGIVAQSAEMTGHQHEQLQALAEVITILLGRVIEHDKRAVQSFVNTVTILGLVRTLADTIGDPAGSIAQAAAEALALLNTEADVQIDVIEAEAARARTLLRVAQSTARADLADAVATAQTMRVDAAAMAAESPAE